MLPAALEPGLVEFPSAELCAEPPIKSRLQWVTKLSRAWGLWLAVLLASSFGLRAVRLDSPSDYAIFDEIYYLNSARIILGLPPRTAGQNLTRVGVPIAATPYAGRPAGVDPNSEHPPLGKLILAASLAILGDTPVAWRMPSALFGTLAVLCVFGLARALRAPPSLALLAAFIFAFDNVVYVLSHVGMLDMIMLAFLLAGCWAYAAKRPILAGLAVGLATLTKLTGVDGFLALSLFELGLIVLWWARRRTARPAYELEAEYRPASWAQLRRFGLMTCCWLVSVIALLWVMDARWTLFDNPVRHLQYMTQQAAKLTRSTGPLYDESYPWQWLANDTEINFFKREVDIPNTRPPIKRTLIFYRGAMNPFVLAMTPLAVASAVYLVIAGNSVLALFSLCLFAATYLSNFPPAIFGSRVEYIYYFALVVPAVALATAQFLRRFMPSFLTWTYAAAVLFGFYEYFPFRDLVTPWLFH